MKLNPKLKTVEKYEPLYPLNKFPTDFALNLGREIVYFLATRETPRLEGTDWEEIFSRLVHANHKPSNVGLDDIVLEQTAWGAKTVKNPKPSRVSKIRLISGRNSPIYSYGDEDIMNQEPQVLGEKILTIWNERVASIRSKYKHVRTVVLIKSQDLLELAVFEFETVLFAPPNYFWSWNKSGNLEGTSSTTNEHAFTWQPHGSQFTIIENVPSERLALRIRKPEKLDKQALLDAMKFDPSWVELIR